MKVKDMFAIISVGCGITIGVKMGNLIWDIVKKEIQNKIK